MAFGVQDIPLTPELGFFKGWDNVNALRKNAAEAEKARVEARYAPVSTLADAASKMTYSQLMGPQFTAKFMGNPDILANMRPDQRENALRIIYGAGTGQGAGNNVLQDAYQKALQQATGSQSNSLSGWITDKIKDLVGQGSNANQTNTLVSQPNLSQNDISSIQNMQPGDAYQVQGNNLSYTPQSQDSFYEKSGRAAGIKAEGQKAGELRAQDINDLGDLGFSAQTKQQTLNDLGGIISSPAFENVRQTPILGDKELAYFQRYGTPEQQEMIGKFIVGSGNIIRDASQDFKGAFRKGEQELLQNMKVNPSDTYNAARGKLEELSVLNQMIMQRAQLTAQYMNQYHMSKVEASQLADKQVNGDAIRKRIHNQLNPRATEDDIKFMMQKHNKSRDEIVSLLKAKGKY